MSLASTGSPIGGILYPIILTNLIHHPNVGFGWGQRVCGFLTLFLLGIAAVTIQPTPLRRKTNFILLDAFLKPMFSLQVAGLFFVVLGLWTPFFYFAEYGLSIGMAPRLASYLFAIINAGSFVGRALGGGFALYIGQFNIMTFACYASSILLFCWLKVTACAGLIVLFLLFGATSGIIIALMMSTISHTADNPSNVSRMFGLIYLISHRENFADTARIGTYIGMAAFVVGFAGLAGTPIAGALIDHGYNAAIIFSASSILVGAVIFTAARYTYANDKLIA